MSLVPPVDIYHSLKHAQAKSTLTRIKIGAYLSLMQDDETLWRGKSAATTFRKFLIEEGFEPRAAFQYIEIARCFVFDLAVPTEQLGTIAVCGISLLHLASRCATQENFEEIACLLSALPKAEARQELERILGQQLRPGQPPLPPTTRPVSKILDMVDGLPFEDRSELFRKLGMPHEPAETAVLTSPPPLAPPPPRRRLFAMS